MSISGTFVDNVFDTGVVLPSLRSAFEANRVSRTSPTDFALFRDRYGHFHCPPIPREFASRLSKKVTGSNARLSNEQETIRQQRKAEQENIRQQLKADQQSLGAGEAAT